VGRFGGDEFVLYLRNIPEDALHAFAQRLLSAAHELDPVQKPPLSASIGIALINHSGLAYEEVFYRADKALCYGTNTQRERMKPLQLKKSGTIRCTFTKMNLIAGTYWFDVALRRLDMFAYDYAAQAVRFTVYNTIDETGVARLEHRWQTDTE
jgi:hypothetical protein